MTEGERITLYNDLCDYKEELQGIHYPSQTRQIDILSRAILFVRGTRANWLKQPNSVATFQDQKFIYFSPVKCSSCAFPYGRSDFRICPNCGARMQK